MYQSFDAKTSPDQCPPRLRALRAEMAEEGLDAFLVPRADAHQGETVPPSEERLAWLTGFTGSAGIAAITQDEAGLFVDGRYTVQGRSQTPDEITPVPFPATKPGPWLAERLPDGAKIGLDPWLHTPGEVEALQRALGATRSVIPTANLVDRIWSDRPAPPSGAARAWPDELAGATSASKRAQLAAGLREKGERAAVLTLPDSITWLLNIRGTDIARSPVVLAFAILHDDGRLQLFTDPAKVADLDLDPEVSVAPADAFPAALTDLDGPVRVDRSTSPWAVSRTLEEADIAVSSGDDPCALPKATKTEAEIAATREAHLRDAAAMVEFLAWIDRTGPGGELTEIDVVQELEARRRATNALLDISFDTIAGAGPNGAIVHYRVDESTNRPVQPGELLLVDSGGQYLDGTTDITRTVAIGPPTDEHRRCFTAVLQGMIAISAARFPRGIAGRDLDALARAALWREGLDYDHGTGHGVGVYLNVHEGPQRLSRQSETTLQAGMILSNEPGYYREGAFGIRIENLIVTIEAPPLGDDRDQLAFETLTWVPIDRNLIDATRLAPWERAWIDTYHAEVRKRVGPRVTGGTLEWLQAATQPI